MDAEQNLKTIRLFAEIEQPVTMTGPARIHFRTMARRIAYLYEKWHAISDTVPRKNFLSEEIDSLFVLLAHYSVLSGADVRAVILKHQGSRPVDIARFDAILAAARTRFAPPAEPIAAAA